MLHISRSAYYKWASGKKSTREQENEEIAKLVAEINRDHARVLSASDKSWESCAAQFQEARFILRGLFSREILEESEVHRCTTDLMPFWRRNATSSGWTPWKKCHSVD